jgi:hypothetical protein
MRTSLAWLVLAGLSLAPMKGQPQDVRQTEAGMMKQAEANIERYR